MEEYNRRDRFVAELLAKILVLTSDLERLIENGHVPPEAIHDQIEAIKLAMSSALLTAYLGGQAEVLEENVLGYEVDLAVRGLSED